MPGVEYKYDDAVLKRLQETELEMLKVFDKICQKYEIEYFVSFGTAIGAVRHKGFIPWDDDIDVCMMREDYERLRKVPAEEWEGYYLSDPRDDFATHSLSYPQIYKLGTVFDTTFHNRYDYYKDKDAYRPIWLDIFLFDRVKDVEEVKKKAKKAFFLQKMFYYAKCGFKVYKEDTLNSQIRCITKRFLYNLFSLSKDTPRRIYNKLEKYVSNTKECEYITSYDLEHVEHMIIYTGKYDDFFPTLRVPFEDMQVNLQKNYDEKLTKQYGDYLKMPPEEFRYNHPPKILDFGDGKGNVIKED